MKLRVLMRLATALLILSVLAPVRPATADMPAALSAQTPFAVSSPISFNEVMPRPAAGQPDWVELAVARPPFSVYLPVLLRGVPAAADAPPAPSSPAAPAAVINGWQIADGAGHNYTIPDALPPVPAGAFVLIYFDGLGPAADDYNLADKLAVLHTPAGLVNTLADAQGQVALYTGSTHTPGTLRDFVAWGGPPGQAAADAVADGLWQEGWYVNLNLGSGAAEEGALLGECSFGLYAGHSNTSPDDWALYLGADRTPGAPNPAPSLYWSTVADGVTMSQDGFALGWMYVPGATYHFEMADNAAMNSPLVDLVLDEPSYIPQVAPPVGTFYWRVRALLETRTGPWSGPWTVTVLPAPVTFAPNVELSMNWLRQRKDTKLLCLDGDNEGNPAAPPPKETWDAMHPDAIYTHGRNNCVRASIAMIVTHYGGNLSQDRLSYQLIENNGAPIEDHGEIGNPLKDLGHDQTTLVCGGSGSNGGTLLAWALGIAVADYTYAHDKPTFAQVNTWIDAGRPIMRFNSGHQTVIGGYRTLGDGTQQVRLFDPWTAVTWVNYNTLDITCYYVPPASAPGVRSDEPGISSDADGDGIMDWDEQVRFHTDPLSADTEGDWVSDKQDLREYVFDTAGAYSLRAADFDGDSNRKELDFDNDGDGSVDGCEDTNFNGKYEPALGETNNFGAASSQACKPVFNILQSTQTTPVNAGAYDGPDKVLLQVRVAFPPAASVPTYGPADFKVHIGSLNTNVVSAYRVADTYFLLVQPPVQSAADYYDLTVWLGAQVDTETRAVFYLPKQRADQVLVVDRSGSMLDYDKMAAAKNAARAFIDHTNVDDKIGVVSFSATASVDYALTTVAGAVQWDAAKAAVDALTPSTTTALGAGARLGYDQIVTSGSASHDWMMALLSDGMENELPYWSDATVSGVIVPSRVAVHTVALGLDADLALMGQIAAETGGTFYSAGTDILPLAAPLVEAPSPALPSAPVLPATLPNRLADVYKTMAEDAAHQQRLFARTGSAATAVGLEVPVEKGLPEAVFSVNWDLANQAVFTLKDPKGNTIPRTDPKIFRDDATHEQYRIANPDAGIWTVQMTSGGRGNYLFMLSGPSRTTMHLAFGLPPEDRLPGEKMPILVALADTAPIKGAVVSARLQGPNSDLVETLTLFDDGAHNDGRSGDGVYGNSFTTVQRPGAYLVNATASGQNNAGESFIRYRTGSFVARPRIAYIWLNDLATANAYRTLIEANGLHMDFVPMANVGRTDWTRFALVIVGPDTGNDAVWDASAGVLMQYTLPVLGLGRGGNAFFGKVPLQIGFPNGRHQSVADALAVDPAHALWHSPYAIPLGGVAPIVQVYRASEDIAIPVKAPTTLILLGQEPASQSYYNILEQDAAAKRYLLWGWQQGPKDMTANGRRLFINVLRFLLT